MAAFKRNQKWVVWVVALASIGTGLAVTQYSHADKHPADAVLKAPGVTSARELSAAFRSVSKEALPSIVSIETIGKAVQVDNRKVPDVFGEGSPFGDLFKQDPKLEELFKNQPKQAPRPHSMGSGFIIDAAGVVLTNNHVVAGAETVKIKLWDGREFMAKDVKTDPKCDLAVVKFDAPKDLHALKLGDSDEMEIGDWVIAVGSPFGLDLTVTAGIISAKGRGVGLAEREDFLQTDAAINPGNSGGPLLNLDGEVIGINTAISSRSGGFDGVGFAIPVNMAKWVSQQLLEKGIVSRGFLGVGIQGVSNELSQQFHTPVNQGAIVTQVMPDSPAAKSGLETGDVIVSLDHHAVRTPRDLQGVVERLKIGQKYPLEVLRGAKKVELTIAVGETPANVAAKKQDGQTPEEGTKPDTQSYDNLGLEIQAVTPELAKQLGYPADVTGVVVSTVKDGSPASEAGLKTGLIIEKVGQHKVTSPAEFAAAMKTVKVEEGVLFLVRTPNGAQFVIVGK